mmetsp:Transcript_51782/g.119001  ORF Transcript_51782/g.119001 Transcript_51782/m.119001 type:complete len:227 (-) Transcript_51782:48-728(-)
MSRRCHACPCRRRRRRPCQAPRTRPPTCRPRRQRCRPSARSRPCPCRRPSPSGRSCPCPSGPSDCRTCPARQQVRRRPSRSTRSDLPPPRRPALHRASGSSSTSGSCPLQRTGSRRRAHRTCRCSRVAYPRGRRNLSRVQPPAHRARIHRAAGSPRVGRLPQDTCAARVRRPCARLAGSHRSLRCRRRAAQASMTAPRRWRCLPSSTVAQACRPRAPSTRSRSPAC